MIEFLKGRSQSKWLPWFGVFARLVLGGVLFAAGWLKAFNSYEAQASVRAYDVLPTEVANYLGLSLPWIEIGIALLLILGFAVKPASAISGFLMLLFIVAISQAGIRGLSIDCGCFGGGGFVEPGKTKYLQEIARDAGLFLLALYLYRYPLTKFSIESALAKSSNDNTEGN